MKQLKRILSTKDCTVSILFFLLIIDIFVYFDISIIRQVLAFIFLSFIPGVLIIYILRLRELDISEKFVFSVGLSISFLMFCGLLINWLFPLLGNRTPLSSKSLIISFNLLLLILIILFYLSNKNFPHFERCELNLKVRDKAFLVIPVIFPLLSVIGMHLMNITGNNKLLIVLLISIPIYIVFITIFRNHVAARTYPSAIFLISISVVILLGLRSSHIIGVDAHTEYYIFQQTVMNGAWRILINSTLDSCLSISILPTIYLSFLGSDSEYIFKIYSPILFATTPILVYLISKKYIGEFYAFLASFFFISQIIFINAATSPRTVMGIFFFALAIGASLLDHLNETAKRLLFIVFFASCIISHYSTTYIFFFTLLLTWLGLKAASQEVYIRERVRPASIFADNLLINSISNKVYKSSTSGVQKILSYSILLIFFAMIFLWYSQVTGAAFNSGINFIITSLNSLQDFFILESRNDNVSTAFGSKFDQLGLSQKINFVVSWASIIFIATGVLIAFLRLRQVGSISQGGGPQFPIIQFQKMDAHFVYLSLACSAILAAAVVVPFITSGYGIDRAYCLMMVVLSVFFIIGGIIISKFLHIKQIYLMILLILIPYFMCNSGIMYQILGDPVGVSLNSDGREYDLYYIHDHVAQAAKWLKNDANDNIEILSDFPGSFKLISQGSIYSNASRNYDSQLLDNHRHSFRKENYFFLPDTGVSETVLTARNLQRHNITEYDYFFFAQSLIYSNGGSKIYFFSRSN